MLHVSSRAVRAMPVGMVGLVMIAVGNAAWASAYGGNGGNPFSNTVCGNDQVVATLKLRAGSYVDSITPFCTKVNANGSWAGASTQGPGAGGNGGSPYTLSCEPGAAVVAITGRAGSYVDSLGIVCRKLAGVTAGGVNFVNGSDSKHGPHGGAGGTAFTASCPSGQVAKGFKGRAAAWLDQIELVCHIPQAQVPAAALTASTLSSNTRVHGSEESVTWTMTFSAPLPASGEAAKVFLTSSRPDVVEVPAYVMAGSTGATSIALPITTKPVTAETAVTLTARYGTSSRNVTLTVKPLLLTALKVAKAPTSPTLTSASVQGGEKVRIRLELNANPGGQFVVPLVVSDAAVTMAASYPMNDAAAEFDVDTQAVSADVTATIRAGEGSLAKTAELQIKAPVVVEVMLLQPPPAAGTYVDAGEDVMGGQGVPLRIRLSGRTPFAGNMTLPVRSSDPALQFPDTITIGPNTDVDSVMGQALSVASDVRATVTVGSGAGAKSDTVIIKPYELTSVTVPATATGGSVQTGRVKLAILSAPSSFYVDVPLSSSNPTVAAVPATLRINSQRGAETFTVQTSAVANDTTVSITAGTGIASKSASLTVQAIKVSSLTISPASFTGGTAVSGQFQLTGPAPAGGLNIPLASSSAAATVPATVSVAQGGMVGTFQVTTAAVPADTTVTITAGEGSAAKATTIVVRR